MKLNLVENDNLNRETLQEAVTFKWAHQIRHVFAVLRVYNDMMEPEVLWSEFKDSMTEDYKHHGLPDLEAEYLARE